MGSVCGKPSLIEEDKHDNRRERPLKSKASESRVARSISSSKAESTRVKDKGDVRFGSADKRSVASRRVSDENSATKGSYQVSAADYEVIQTVPKALEGEQVAAGWPSWLVSEASEAIKGWVPEQAENFEKIKKIGQGTYSSVYMARDTIRKKLVALKDVRFACHDPESVKFMAREILILRRLDHPNIIKLDGLIISPTASTLSLVFEYMEHDLTGLASIPGVKFTEPQVKCYMQQILNGLDHCHSRGVLHRDIKGSNLLIDDSGILKIADFGLASFFDHDQSVPLTSRVVTLWYRPPELLVGSTHYGAAVDLWSAGCILGELYAGKPIMPGSTEVEQLHKIFKLCGAPSDDFWRKLRSPHSTVFKPPHQYKRRLAEALKEFPVPALCLLDTLLALDPDDRGTADSALKSEFFAAKPHACDPSDLPKYPPSKEIDAKRRDEEARRRRAAGLKARNHDCKIGSTNENMGVTASDANSESVISIQKRQGLSKPNCSSDLLLQTNTPQEVATKQYSEHFANKGSYSGPLVQGGGLTKNGKDFDRISVVPSTADLSMLSGLVASRTTSSENQRDTDVPSKQKLLKQVGKLSESSQGYGLSKKQPKMDHSLGHAAFHGVENSRANIKEPIGDFQGFNRNKTHFSGPLLFPMHNMEQMLKERDRQFQEAARRARLEKMSKAQAEEANRTYLSSRRAR